MIHEVCPVGSLLCNCQILVCESTREAVLIDTGDEPQKILSALETIESKLGGAIQVRALLHTHAHFDHFGATRKVKEALMARNPGSDAPWIGLHPADQFLYEKLVDQGRMFGFPQEAPLPVDRFVQDDEVITIGKMKFTFLHTPGHSPGGLSIRLHESSSDRISESVFTGDTLFRESIGRSDLWGGDSDLLEKSIQDRLYTLDGDTWAWPGHGLQTKIGHERIQNPYVRGR